MCGKYAKIILLFMFVPEYSITQKILKNISIIEYSKAILDTTKILPSWEKQLQREATARKTYSNLQMMGINYSFETVKKVLDQMSQEKIKEASNIEISLNLTEEIAKNKELEEVDLKYLHKTLSNELLPKAKQGSYRSTKIPGKTSPEEILAEMTELFDWYNSLDAKESHPVITAGIIKAKLEVIQPFESFNFTISNLASEIILKMSDYNLGGYTSLEDYYHKTKTQYEQLTSSIARNSADFTWWIDYFTEGLALEASNIKEKVTLLAKDTKIAKTTGRIKLTSRQERIVEYLQDYGILQNKDFKKVFGDISEDSILRDLKLLTKMGMVQKNGSTKSSKYELK